MIPPSLAPPELDRNVPMDEQNPVLFTLAIRQHAMDSVLATHGIVPCATHEAALARKLQGLVVEYLDIAAAQLQDEFDFN